MSNTDIVAIIKELKKDIIKSPVFRHFILFIIGLAIVVAGVVYYLMHSDNEDIKTLLKKDIAKNAVIEYKVDENSKRINKLEDKLENHLEKRH